MKGISADKLKLNYPLHRFQKLEWKIMLIPFEAIPDGKRMLEQVMPPLMVMLFIQTTLLLSKLKLLVGENDNERAPAADWQG